MNRHKLIKEDADRMIDDVRTRYMQQNNGEAPAECPGQGAGLDMIGTPEGGMFIDNGQFITV